MGRVFLSKRYTLKTCPDSVVKPILQWFGSFKIFGKAKVIHSAAVWENTSDGKFYSININENAP